MSERDFRPTASWAALELRAQLLQRVRAFFAERGFLEVETPLLCADTVVDLHLEPIEVPTAGIVGGRDAQRPRWLQTSPEFCMKRLLAAGGPHAAPRPIFQICKAFRGEEAGPLHNAEFTIIEWYRPGDDDAAGRRLLDAFCRHTLNAPPAEEVTFRELFQRAFAIDPHTIAVAELQALAQAKLPSAAGFVSDNRDAWLDLLFAEVIQPQLGRNRPTILHDYPASQAALAQTRYDAHGAEVAARFELFVDGVELANGYHELQDADELRARMARTNALRRAAGKRELPQENRLLQAMEAGLPACSGCALGFDRLVMVAGGYSRMAEVLPFPWDRA